MQSKIDLENSANLASTSESTEPVWGVMSLCFPKHEIMIEEEITGKDALNGSNAEQFQFSTSKGGQAILHVETGSC